MQGDRADLTTPALRRIWLCADDYGIAPGVDAAIRDLVLRGRLNATSVIVASPNFIKSEGAPLAMLNAGQRRVALGLHLTLTAPFKPISAGFRPLHRDALPPLSHMVARGLLRGLDPQALAAEIAAQFAVFQDAFGRPPDFVDGHQHVHLLPQVREALLEAMQNLCPQAWVRQCGNTRPLRDQLDDPKGLFIHWLSRGMRRRAQQYGIATNPSFAGTYAFEPDADFANLVPQFLMATEDGGVIMCHPGHVDAQLAALDPLTGLREREYEYLISDAFGAELVRQSVALA